jgi:hypothetical protein
LAAHTIAQSVGNSYGNLLSRTRFYLTNKSFRCWLGRIICGQIVPDNGLQEDEEIILLSLIGKCDTFYGYLFGILISLR